MTPITSIFFFFLLMSLSLNVFATPQQTGSPFRVVGCLPDYRIDQVNASWMTRLTDLVYFSIQPDKSGELDLGHLDQPSFEELRQLTRKNKVRLSICVGGCGKSQGFSTMAPDQNLRQDFIHQLKNFCLLQDLDGVDFDWEFPQNREEVIAYERLLVETKAAFQQHRLLVTVAVGPHMFMSSPIYEALDYIHLMSYDHSAQHSTYRESLSDVAQQLEFGVPAKKLCLEIPFYGRAVENWHQATA